MIKELEERIEFITYLLPAADKQDRKKMRLVIAKLQNEIKMLKYRQTNESSIKRWLEAVDEFLSPQYLENKYLNKTLKKQVAQIQ